MSLNNRRHYSDASSCASHSIVLNECRKYWCERCLLQFVNWTIVDWEETIIEVDGSNASYLNGIRILWTKTNQSLIYIYASRLCNCFPFEKYFTLRQPINLICSKPKWAFWCLVGWLSYETSWNIQHLCYCTSVIVD